MVESVSAEATDDSDIRGLTERAERLYLALSVLLISPVRGGEGNANRTNDPDNPHTNTADATSDGEGFLCR